MLPFNAAILMAMEVSTPFLNLGLLLRHRGPAFKKCVELNGLLFLAFFILFRLILNTYGAILLWYHRRSIPPTVPKWQAWFLLVAVAAGAVVQFWWFPIIAKSFGGALSGYLRHRSVASDLGSGEPLQGGAGQRRSRAGTPAENEGGRPGNNATDYGSNADGDAVKTEAPNGEAENSPETALPQDSKSIEDEDAVKKAAAGTGAEGDAQPLLLPEGDPQPLRSAGAAAEGGPPGLPSEGGDLR
mmetsp:Transcript_68275/g.211238  ORF Transcript_68275/g.211238 Transcript_68275/m.211238 type:complete len:243 (+) Transcript_68275:657-1385(+)